MLYPLLLAALLALSTAQDSKPCCGPELFEGSMTVTNSEQAPGSFEGSFYAGTVHFDSQNRRMSSVLTAFTKQGTYKVTVVERADATFLWLPETQQCNKMPIVLIDNCVDPTLKLLTTVRVGIKPSLDVNVYQKSDDNSNSYTQMQVTKDQCVPIQQSNNNGNDGKQSFWSFTYNNIVLSIKDMSVFDVPSYCTSGDAAPVSEDVITMYEQYRDQRGAYL